MMCKFSIIVPIYNTSKYLNKCFDSIINQTFDDYEVICVNDGSTDNSINIINKYCKNKKFKCITTKNNGLSEARNIGVDNSSGEYILFLDSDDYIDNKLLENINNNLSDEDVIRFQVREVDDNYNCIKEYHEKEFKHKKIDEAIDIIINYHFIENAWCYAYKKKFYVDNKFKFIKGIYHEDFALIPLILCKCRFISSIDYIGYNYTQRNNSIMNTNNYDKTKKKAYDFLIGYDYLYKEINNLKIDIKVKKIILSYISNCIILKLRDLNKDDFKAYKNKLLDRKVYDNILDDTIKRKIKKIFIKYLLNR